MGKSGLFIHVFLLSVVLCQTAVAEDKHDFVFKRHEIYAGTGIVPGRYAFGYNYPASSDYFLFPGIYESSRYYEREYVSGVWSLGYTCNFTKILAVQANLFYEAGWTDRFSRETNARTGGNFDSYLSAMASFKVYWYNRPAVRMYSWAGLGLSFNSRRSGPAEAGGTEERVHTILPAFQLTPFGVQFGRKLFGFSEVGIGHYFCGISIGLGYRF